MFKQISIFLKNEPGELAKFADLLKDYDIEIRAITVAENEDYGLILLLVDKPDECIKLLEKQDQIYSITEVIPVKVQSKEGNTQGLKEISKTLGENNINIQYLYTALMEEEKLLVLRVDDNEKAIEILRENGFLLEEREKI
ncbi:MAG: hypothetical protein GF317_10250 [Candidatus Lokiarchaeota archaeon]|nr:hypothetical protein [Candidatus Lokiarchaeota archaeon]MBD3200041.1 hypothetical protein [Candidatus Lokiarchaeota archaeon]